jgi:drug/metabolite transporter (DMT)-like permease
MGGSLVFASALCYAIYLVGAGGIIGRLGSTRFIAWAMLASTVFVLGQFLLTRPLSALDVPLGIHALSLAMAVFSTVLPTWLVAEAIRRIGANHSSLVGSLGPVFTIGLAAMILGEPTHPIQLAGAAFVLAGVLLVSLKGAPSPTAS